MTKEQQIQILKVRLHKLKSSEKSLDSPGVMKKVERQLRNLQK